MPGAMGDTTNLLRGRVGGTTHFLRMGVTKRHGRAENKTGPIMIDRSRFVFCSVCFFPRPKPYSEPRRGERPKPQDFGST